MNVSRAALLIVALAAVPTGVSAAPVVIDFESLSDSEAVTNQFGGLTFSNAVALTAGISLNEFEFPPSSGANVVFDDSGPMRIDFASAMASVGGYFTYGTALTFDAFDSGDNLIASVSSAFGSNLALSGDAGSSPSEFLSVAGAGIAYVVLSGDGLGSSFVLDDFTYDDGNVVPEPGTLSLMLLAGFEAARRRRRAH